MLNGFRLLRRPPLTHHHHHHHHHHHLLRLSITTVDHLDLLLHRCQTPKQSSQIHAQIILSGLRHSPFHAASLVSLYSRHGRLSAAISTFRSIPTVHSNTLLWNCILRAHLSHACPDEALRLYLEMRARGVPPDAFTFPLITRAASSCIGDRALCGAVHAHAIVGGFGYRLHAGNELVAMYGRIGELGIACEVFDGMSVRTVESWNTLMSAHALDRDFRGADELFRKMVSGGGAPRPNAVTWTSLLSAHARGGREVEVLRLFYEMRAHCEESPTAESVGVVLSVCADLGEVDYGRGVHALVVKVGYEDYVFVRNSIVCVCGRVREVGDAERAFSEIREKNLVSWNGLISSYASAGLCWEAFEAFTRLEREGGVLRPNVVSWSVLIRAFAMSGVWGQLLETFRRMQTSGVEPNLVTTAIVLSACSEMTGLRLGKEVHGHMVRRFFDGSVLVGNRLVDMYAKCGSLRLGRRLFDGMKNKDLVTWNLIISGYGMHGFGEDALGLFSKMLEAGFVPDGITFVAVLSACSHAGLVIEGRRLFDRMVEEFNVVPSMEHYACMVDLLGRAGLLREANEVVERMPMRPNECVWGALLNSSRIHKNTSVAEEVATRIFELDVEKKRAGSYMLLSNVYASCGRWDDSARVRDVAMTNGIRKSPGWSWIELNEGVFTFMSGEDLPSCMEDVYWMLELLNWGMDGEAPINGGGIFLSWLMLNVEIR